ncbi:ABC transporter substrate-binding protein [Acinetobacter chinensis]|uniref:ABC transporter substrate-binding protein n=1 Tax=Acinetobacter chinensis TaxID=2004650 RepID=A0ABU3WDF6_9GAMM|nr:ABC transporter substrate-binding protein [Acinetobacter chinensis]MDV2468418.1 ABC transporter substrate-binding protein [Acinetobacter chinensis]
MCDDDINHSRRDFLKLMGLFTGTAALPIQASLAQTKPENTQTKRVRIGYIPITDATPLLVACQNKLFEKQGLEVDPPVYSGAGHNWWKLFYQAV